MPAAKPCPFCSIRDGQLPAHTVIADGAQQTDSGQQTDGGQKADVLAFLDARPVFPGHTLVVPRVHYSTLAEVPDDVSAAMWKTARQLAAAVRPALGADGAFVALNDEVSQSVAHVHIHVVPRRRKDGLRGFFWPRQRYDSDAEAAAVACKLAAALRGGQPSG